MSERIKVWVDRKIIPIGKANVPIFSHAVGRGSSIFEVMTCHGTPDGTVLFRPNAYIGRFGGSARFIGMELPYSPDELLQAIKLAVRSNKLSDGIIKMIALWPEVQFEVLPSNPRVSVAIAAFDPNIELFKSRSLKFNKPIRAVTVALRKLDPRTVPVEAKVAANYLNAMLAKMEAKKKGADVPIMMDTSGYLAEGATESLFIARGNKLFTPKLKNILPGITRDSVISIVRNLGIPISERRLKPDALGKATEVFFTTSPMKVWSASHVDGRILGNGKPGPIALRISDELSRITSGKLPEYRNWLVPVN